MSDRHGAFSLADYTFLLIEDEAVFRSQLTAFLKQRGAIVAQAENGRHGLRLVDDLAPDLVLCDLRMPEIDGQEVLRTLLKKQPDLPVIVISAASDMPEVATALRHGAKDYFIKPLQSWLTLAQTISNILSSRPSSLAVQRDLKMAEAELASHMAHFRQHDPASTLLMQELASERQFSVNGLHVKVESQPLGVFVVYYALNSEETSIFVLDVSLFGTEAAVTGALIKSLLNDSFRQQQSNGHFRLRSPAQMLTYLNQQVHHLKLVHQVNLMQLQFQQGSFSYSNAGFAAPNAELQLSQMGLGLLPEQKYQESSIAMTGALTLYFHSQLGSELRLKIEAGSR